MAVAALTGLVRPKLLYFRSATRSTDPKQFCGSANDPGSKCLYSPRVLLPNLRGFSALSNFACHPLSTFFPAANERFVCLCIFRPPDFQHRRAGQETVTGAQSALLTASWRGSMISTNPKAFLRSTWIHLERAILSTAMQVTRVKQQGRLFVAEP